MGLMDKLADGAERAAREAEKAFDKGKTKVGELQVEMQMDQLARKLGYLVFDFYRGRQVDQAVRQKILDDLSRLEDQLLRVRAQAAAKAQSDEAAGTTPPADSGPAAGTASAAEAPRLPKPRRLRVAARRAKRPPPPRRPLPKVAPRILVNRPRPREVMIVWLTRSTNSARWSLPD